MSLIRLSDLVGGFLLDGLNHPVGRTSECDKHCRLENNIKVRIGEKIIKKRIGRPKKLAKKVSLKQEKFIEEYIETGNATQSAIVAGYSANSASVQGSRLINNKAVAGVTAEVKRDIAQELKDNAHIAYDVLQGIMLDNKVSAKVRSDVASNLLDRAGFKAVEKKVVTGSVSGNINQTVILDLVQRARELMAKKAEAIEVECTILD